MSANTSRLPLHFQILIGILLGAGIGFVASNIAGGPDFVSRWIKPVGDIFIRLLKFIAVPLNYRICGLTWLVAGEFLRARSLR